VDTKLANAGWKSYSVSIPVNEEFARQMIEIRDLYLNGLPPEENQRREAYLKTRWGRFRNRLACWLESAGVGLESWFGVQAAKVRPPQSNYGLEGMVYQDLFSAVNHKEVTFQD